MGFACADRLLWDTVGRGLSKPTCRSALGYYIECGDHPGEDYVELKSNCKDVMCNRCHGAIQFKRAVGVAERMAGVDWALHLAGVLPKRAIVFELILSPPPSSYFSYESLREYRKLLKKADAMANRLGMPGGYRVTHAVRGTPGRISLYKKHDIELPPSFHHHYIGPMVPDLAMTYLPMQKAFQIEGWRFDDFYRETGGWIYKPVLLMDPTIAGMTSKLNYELNHAAVYQKAGGSGRLSRTGNYLGTHTSRYAKLVSKRKVTEKRVCAVCGAQSKLMDRVYEYSSELDEMVELMGTEICDAETHMDVKTYAIKNENLARAAEKLGLLIGRKRSENLDLASCEDLDLPLDRPLDDLE